MSLQGMAKWFDSNVAAIKISLHASNKCALMLSLCALICHVCFFISLTFDAYMHFVSMHKNCTHTHELHCEFRSPITLAHGLAWNGIILSAANTMELLMVLSTLKLGTYIHNMENHWKESTTTTNEWQKQFRNSNECFALHLATNLSKFTVMHQCKQIIHVGKFGYHIHTHARYIYPYVL